MVRSECGETFPQPVWRVERRREGLDVRNGAEGVRGSRLGRVCCGEQTGLGGNERSQEVGRHPEREGEGAGTDRADALSHPSVSVQEDH